MLIIQFALTHRVIHGQRLKKYYYNLMSKHIFVLYHLIFKCILLHIFNLFNLSFLVEVDRSQQQPRGHVRKVLGLLVPEVSFFQPAFS